VAFTCPECGRTSQSPDDARQGYCGACHGFTGVPGSRGLWQYVGRYIAERYGAAVPLDELAREDLITGSQRNPGTDSGDSPCQAREADDIPWANPMQWSPGDAEW
jgi:hypothetical protein